MRFNVGDILRLRNQQNTIRWKIEAIEGERYFITYVLAEGEEWRNGSWFNEAACIDLELDGLQQPLAPPAPVQREITIYALIYKVEADRDISVYSSPDKNLVERYKAATEGLGCTTIATKKFKTRI